MIVDDEDFNLMFLNNLLTKMFTNMQIIKAVDGLDGIQQFKNHNIDGVDKLSQKDPI